MPSRSRRGSLPRSLSERVRTSLLGLVAVPVLLASPVFGPAPQALAADPTPLISISDVQVNENVGQAVLTISLDRPTSQAVTVSYTTANDNVGSADALGRSSCAVAGADYVSESGSVLIPANSQIPPSKQLTIAICDDQRDEFAETFLVRLTAASRFALDPTQKDGRVTIQDNDAAPSLSIADLTVTEGDGGTKIAHFPVTLSQASGKPVTVHYSTQVISGGALGGGSCTGPVDYVSVSNQELTFPAGTTTRNADITLCSDLVDGGNESFRVKLSSPTNASISDGTAQGTIKDDDNPFLTINNVSISEPALGASMQAEFTINLHAIVPDHNVTVHYQTANGTARGGASCLDESAPDYVTESGTATIVAGQASRTITIKVCGNGSQLLSRTFSVQLSGASNGVPITDATGTGTIGGLTLPISSPIRN